jgi:hypothetical protein
MKAGLRNFMFNPWFVVLEAATGWTTSYFVTWEMTVLARFGVGTIAAAADGDYTAPWNRSTCPIRDSQSGFPNAGGLSQPARDSKLVGLPRSQRRIPVFGIP